MPDPCFSGFSSFDIPWQSLEDKSSPGQGLTFEQDKNGGRIVKTTDLLYSICLLSTYKLSQGTFLCFSFKLTMKEER